ncbi:hypothetical protein [Paenibacillus elgii]|uniref:hypothetical protein n=1 Tax=Paenibacillus elgii TaxID=189691 RepID=UPI00203E23AF|nr:hypothetical protein [Paenibacillus elgii]MCM3270868.1 hypothetical protein [Paenibacillus elgii]
MEWLELVKILPPVASVYIAWLTYRMNKQELERKRLKELQEQDEKNASLPPRSKKRPKR